MVEKTNSNIRPMKRHVIYINYVYLERTKQEVRIRYGIIRSLNIKRGNRSNYRGGCSRCIVRKRL